MKKTWSKKIIQFVSFSSLMSYSITNSYGMCCCTDYSDDEEMASSGTHYSPFRMQREISGEDQDKLETRAIKLSTKQSLATTYGAINPKIFSDGSKVTDCKPGPKELRMFTGAKIGRDDRVRVTDTTEVLWRVHGHLEMLFPNGKKYIGSGTMVNHRHVLTAGHCLYSIDLGGWATAITFSPALNETYYPIIPAKVTHLLTVKGWTDETDSRYDMGMLILDRDLGEETGWYGISSDTDKFLKSLSINVTGYPGDEGKDGRQMWTMPGSIKKLDSDQFTYTLDTTGGQSGSGVWSHLSHPEGNYCVGIHTTGGEYYNTATRISSSKFDRFVSWINTDWK
ncbi:MAG: trypsin-like serine protease [Proteobacteria bacterium]|nr:trypsin-like serine protease [Pseudomonadota bacterium]